MYKLPKFTLLYCTKIYFTRLRGVGVLAGVIGHFSDLSFRNATTQTQAYFGVLGFFRNKFCQKCTLRRSNHFLQIQQEIHFLTFKILIETLQKKIQNRNMDNWTFSFFQICFGYQFWRQGSGQTENTQIRVFVYFPLDHFPKSKIDSEI